MTIPLAFGLVCHAAASVILSRDDIRTGHLPNRKVAVLSLLLVAAATADRAQPHGWAATFGPAVGLFAVFAALRGVTRGGLGMGDVKVSFPCGLLCGWVAGWGATMPFVAGMAAGSVAAAALTAWRAIRGGEASWKESSVPFGPVLFFATWVAVLWVLAPRLLG